MIGAHLKANEPRANPVNTADGHSGTEERESRLLVKKQAQPVMESGHASGEVSSTSLSDSMDLLVGKVSGAAAEDPLSQMLMLLSDPGGVNKGGLLLSCDRQHPGTWRVGWWDWIHLI